jgi:ABC-type phosphate transport system substrate-binding protein
MNLRHKQILFSCALVLFIGHAYPTVSNAESPDDIVVFVNNASSVSNADIAELKQIFLKKKNNWQGGDRIVCVNAAEGTALREEFRKKVLNMTGPEEATYWENQRIRFQLVAPSEMPNAPRAVFKMKAAVGYAYRKDVPKDVVKIILVIPR